MSKQIKKYIDDFLYSLLKMMIRIRQCEESLVEPILNGDVKCPVHLYSGEEAIAAGVCACLKQTDYVFGNHRSHGHYIAKGGALGPLIAEIFGKKNGCSGGRGGSMHVIDPGIGMMGAAPIVGGTISLALGAALASRIRRDQRVSVSFFGDGATGEGVVYEALNFAALKKLPIIFVCENNLYSTHLSIHECRINDVIYEISKPCNVYAKQADGNNVLEVYETTKEAVELCRRNEGPAFIEFITYRLRGHVGADDNVQGHHMDIRPEDEIASWVRKDPIKAFQNHLLASGIITASQLEQIASEIDTEIQEAYRFSHNSPLPNPDELLNHVYR
jgi:acetoin:2,6-dichlorophenolindophenol oxidoreductase subunit alpha